MLPFAKSDEDLNENEGNLIDLYKYYEGVGQQARFQMIVTCHWLLSFAVGLLVFSAQSAVHLTPDFGMCRDPSLLTALAPVSGLVLAGLVWMTVSEFEDHIQRNWFRATRCKYLVAPLYELVAEAGDPVPMDRQEWPEYLQTYDGFRERSAQPTPDGKPVRSRVQGMFFSYKAAAVVLGGLFCLAVPLVLWLDACPEPPSPTASAPPTAQAASH